MKIAVWINSGYQPQEGGGFSYFDRLIKAIDAYEFDSSLDICFVTNGIEPIYLRRKVVYLNATPKLTLGERIKKRLPLVGWHYQEKCAKRIQHQQISMYHQQLQDNEIQLIFYPTSGIVIPNFPSIATNWDIGHLSTYAFPEVAMNGQFEKRNSYYTTQLPQSLLIFCESEAGKSELLQFTNIKEEKLRVVPIFAGACVDVQIDAEEQQKILDQYGLKKHQFFFYPAQFWAHKNHYTLLNAFKEFKKKYPDFKLVLTGSDHGNKKYVFDLIEKYELGDSIVFPGFVPIETINTFYQNTSALVMASYFGPTNMPPLEAMALGCPILCTDLAGHREQLADAALYFDARDKNDLAKKMCLIVSDYDMWHNRALRQKECSIFTIEEALKRINQYLMEALIIRSTWA